MTNQAIAVPTIAVDLRGTDTPGVMMKGVHEAVRQGVQARIVVVGTKRDCEKRPVFVGAEHSSEEKGLRSRDSSVAVCASLVRSGLADAMYSCGNTQVATFWATSDKGIGMIDGFSRSPLALVLPNRLVGRVVLLDAGANVDCTPEHLLEFAKLGDVFARVALGVDDPTVRLLANGTEPWKGNGVIQRATELIKLDGSVRFAGLTEGNKITRGDSHVIVADGLPGNIGFKAIEDGAGLVVAELKDAFQVSAWTKFVGLLARPILRPVRAKLDPSQYGSMPMLGTKGLVMIGHGAVDQEGACAGIFAAANYAGMNLAREIEKRTGK